MDKISTTSTILTTKVRRPPMPVEFVPRTELVKFLDRYRKSPMSLVSAGAGYGKSLTISQWLEETNVLHTWISLDEEHKEDFYKTWMLGDVKKI